MFAHFPGTSCLATFISSLADKDALPFMLTRMGARGARFVAAYSLLSSKVMKPQRDRTPPDSWIPAPDSYS